MYESLVTLLSLLLRLTNVSECKSATIKRKINKTWQSKNNNDKYKVEQYDDDDERSPYNKNEKKQKTTKIQMKNNCYIFHKDFNNTNAATATTAAITTKNSLSKRRQCFETLFSKLNMCQQMPFQFYSFLPSSLFFFLFSPFWPSRVFRTSGVKCEGNGC